MNSQHETEIRRTAVENNLATRSLGLLLRVLAAVFFLVGSGSLIWYFFELSIRTNGWGHPTNVGQDVLVIVFGVGFAALISSVYLLVDNRIPRLLTVVSVVVATICVLAFAAVLSLGLLKGA